MANKGVLDVYINALPQEIRKPLQQAFYHVVDTWKLGDGARALNAQWYATEFTTSSTAGTEFSVAHGMENTPGRFVPVMRLNEVGNTLAGLTVSRAADAQYVYFTSPSTSVVISGFFES